VLLQLANSTNLVDRIYSRHLFSKEASKALDLRGELTKSDLDVLLRHLARDKRIVVFDNEVTADGSSTKFLLRYFVGCEIRASR